MAPCSALFGLTLVPLATHAVVKGGGCSTAPDAGRLPHTTHGFYAYLLEYSRNITHNPT